MKMKEIFGDELGAQVEEQLKGKDNFVFIDTSKGEWIPRTKFNAEQEKLRSQITKLEEELEKRDGQLDELKQKIDGMKEAAESGQKMIEEIERLKSQNAEAKKKYENDLEEQKIIAEIRLELIKAGCRHPQLLVGEFDRNAITAGKDGKIIGIVEQIKEMKEGDYKDQFDEVVLGGETPDEGVPPAGIKNPWMPEHFNVTEQSKLTRDDPVLATRFRKEAGVE